MKTVLNYHYENVFGLSHAVQLEACDEMYPPHTPRSGRAAESSRDEKFGFLIAVHAPFSRGTSSPGTRVNRKLGILDGWVGGGGTHHHPIPTASTIANENHLLAISKSNHRV